jgi:hypothetical protein
MENEPDRNPPPAGSAQPIEYFSANNASYKLVTLCKMGSMEAQLAKLKLESEGIRCFIGGENAAAIYPLAFVDVELQVPESDLQAAKEILKRPADEDSEGEYVEESFRCRKCHSKSVAIVPLSNRQIALRSGFVFLLLLPAILPLLKLIFPSQGFIQFVDAASAWGAGWWIFILFVLGLFILLSKRRKRCAECGYEWDK